MKKRFFLLSSAALLLCAAISLTSCNDIERPAVSDNGTITITFEQVDPELPASADEATRTGYHDSTIWWTEGDKVFFGQYASVSSAMTYKSGGVYTVTSNRETLPTISVTTFNEPDEDTDSYYFSVFPSDSYTSYNTSALGRVIALVGTPAHQTPSSNSYDPAADLLISNYTKNLTPSGEGKYSVQLSYYRQVALGKMRITNLPSNSKIDSIEFSAIHDEKDVTIAGAKWYDFQELDVYSVSSRSYKLTLDYSALDSAKNMTANFCCYPFELDADDSFTVKVYTAAGEVFTKKVTLSALQSLSFEAGRGTRFTVDMSTATKTDSWITVNEYSSASLFKKTYRIYYTFKVAEGKRAVASGKFKAVSEAEFAAISDISAYLDANGTSISDDSRSSINSSGTSYVSNTSGLTGDSWYVAMCKVVLEDSTVGIAIQRIKTDWFTLEATTRAAGGVTIKVYGKDLHATNTRNYRMIATDLDKGGKSFEEYYNSVLSPGYSSSMVDAVNGKNGETAAAYAATTHYTDKTTTVATVAGTSYTVMMKAVNLRGETKFVTASAVAGP